MPRKKVGLFKHCRNCRDAVRTRYGGPHEGEVPGLVRWMVSLSSVLRFAIFVEPKKFDPPAIFEPWVIAAMRQFEREIEAHCRRIRFVVL